MNSQATADEILAKVSQQVSGDRVHANHNQRKRPTPVPLPFQYECESCQEEEAHTAAEEGPGRRPDPLDYRADAGRVEEQPQRNPGSTKDDEAPHHGDRVVALYPSASNKTQNHGSERWNEAQRQVAATVRHERLRSWKQIQKPLIKGVAEIAVLIPMR